MNIDPRPFRDDGDFWRIRSLSSETYSISGPGWNWDIRRWDGSRFHNAEPVLNPEWQRTVRLWERADGRLAGVVNAGGKGWFYLQMHPDDREIIEEEMIAWAEDNLAEPISGGSQRQVYLEVYEYDAPRRRILEKRGYQKMDVETVFRRMRLGSRPVPEVNLASGYSMRPVRHTDLQDCGRMANLLNAAFNRTFHNAMEFYQFAKHAPSFRQDLHLVAEAPDGSFAAHVAAIYDESNRRGLYEPVCTHPEHRRKNLAQSLMYACLQRLKEIGACELTVETGDMIPANALYDSTGFTEVYKSYAWCKEV
jgi:mycothiol synthase